MIILVLLLITITSFLIRPFGYMQTYGFVYKVFNCFLIERLLMIKKCFPTKKAPQQRGFKKVKELIE